MHVSQERQLTTPPVLTKKLGCAAALDDGKRAKRSHDDGH